VHEIEVTLPGGLLNDARLEREVRFRPLTGRIEQSLIELESDLDRPGYVTAVLSNVLDRIGSRPADAARVAELCVADRQYLMLRLGAMLDGEQMWLKVDCGHCDEPFDVEVRRCDLPVKEAGDGFPLLTLRVKEWSLLLRVPTGSDQERAAGLPEERAERELLVSCIQTVNGERPGDGFVEKLTASDIEAIDDALDEASPAICSQLLVNCPECGQEQHAELDHYAPTGMSARFLYAEVHTLASHYHWSESVILDLPQARRRLYLDMIGRSAGASGHV